MREYGWNLAQRLADEQKVTNLAWAAGFFDGEGCIRINRVIRKYGPTYTLQITVRQVDPRPILRFKEIVGNGSIQYYIKSNKGIENARPIYTWSTAGPTAATVLNKLYPYLSSKYEQADIALDFQKTIRYQKGQMLTIEQLEFREECFLKLKELKWQKYEQIPT